MNDLQLGQLFQRHKDLLRHRSDIIQWHFLEVMSLQEVAQVHIQQLEYNAGVEIVIDDLKGTDYIEFIDILLAQLFKNGNFVLEVTTLTIATPLNAFFIGN